MSNTQNLNPLLKNLYERNLKNETIFNNTTGFEDYKNSYEKCFYLNWKNAEVFQRNPDRTLKINNYIVYLNKLLGKGNSSEVYLCKKEDTDQYYAMKIKIEDISFWNFLRKFKKINYKYVVEIKDILKHEDRFYIVLEYLENRSIPKCINNADKFTKWKIFRNLVSTVDHLHNTYKIIHRNISISCCLIDELYTLKLANFTKCYYLSQNSDLIIYDKSQIHKNNIPPEIALSNSFCKVDGKKIDIWCLGNVLYYLVAEEEFLPPDKDDYCYEDYNIDELEVDDPDLEVLIKGLLNVDPNERFTIDQIKVDKWITKDGEFPMPDNQEEALQYYYGLISQITNISLKEGF